MADDPKGEKPSRRPPAATQFKPGRSGNPSGRPKGSRNLSTVLRLELAKRVTVTENGRTRQPTKLELVVQRLAHDSIKGQPKSLELLLKLAATIEALDTNAAGPTGLPIEKPDRAGLRRIQLQLNRIMQDEE